ncbi:hypothetical protein [Nostoc sp. MG11]|uniref:hypothetical protein n=1 Tax=Nostoc sp. MG11 TaxID=2721166 RepID=UPI001867931C|nr:hypothetical protein [Nostoc sp. MG11]
MLAQHSQSRFGEASYLMLLACDWSYQAGDTACQATDSFNSFKSQPSSCWYLLLRTFLDPYLASAALAIHCIRYFKVAGFWFHFQGSDY